jgi:hypothetical protein
MQIHAALEQRGVLSNGQLDLWTFEQRMRGLSAAA